MGFFLMYLFKLPGLCKDFSEDAKPQFTTVIKVLQAIGSGIEVTPLKEDSEISILYL